MGTSLRSLLLGGLAPVILFTILEEKYGTVWGLCAGMIFGAGEISYEWWKNRRVETMTWIGNGMLLGLGSVSLLTQEGIWFKLQPSILESVMGFVLIGSILIKKPLLNAMAKKQGVFEKFPPPLVAFVESRMIGMMWRISLFFLAHAVLAAWAALYWSTRAWALLKGVGFTVTLLAYMLVEALWLRRAIGTKAREWAAANPRPSS